MAETKRPQNRCNACGHTWYPRGKNKSHKCPKCGDSKVRIAGAASGAGALIIAAMVGYAALGDGNSGKKADLDMRPTHVAVTHQVELTHKG